MPSQRSTKLFNPIQVGAFNLQHRVVLAPLTRGRADVASIQAPYATDYYAQRATPGGLLSRKEPLSISRELEGCIRQVENTFKSCCIEKFTTLTEADIDRLVDHYRQAALRAMEAVFDGVELHGAHGYLIDQFASEHPIQHYRGMREADPLSLFVPWVQVIVNAQPSTAYIHAMEPRADDAVDTPDHLQKGVESLNPIREVITRAGDNFIAAGGFTPQ
ncbi:unnamed protein product [Fusarium equiseti]|uniref:NADH:flavin oxidoreductase/NADH oxidase N-terminal domain-containing protein n=1 Tax=Fusarium equiseti TaxID=61235 RepID=A0A8J2IW77_FUSEQ|nr:unnamed protein product [Fusarium equiseti]